MAFHANNELPTTFAGEAYPNQLQHPIETRYRVEATQNWLDATQDPTAAADAIMDYYHGSIANFVGVNRRMYAAGVAPVQRRFLNLPGLTMQYENNGGMERLSLIAFPESVTLGGRVIDLNYDGYIVFILYDPHYPNTLEGVDGYPKSFDLYLNGYRIKKDFKITGTATACVVMFGLTALRCQSLVDARHQNPLEDTPGGLFPQVQPARPKVGGHADVFTYNLFNFTTDQNPNYSKDVMNLFLGLGTSPIKVNVTDGIQFFDAKKSPLNTTPDNSTNYFGVCLSQGVVQATADPIGYFMIAEFYSRKKKRGVLRSWNKIAAPGGSIVANDKPLYWGNTHVTSYTSLTPGQNGMGFDLWGDDGGAVGALAPIPLTSPDADNVSQFQQALSVSDANALNDYFARIAQIELDFANSILPAIRTALAKVEGALATYQADNLKLKKATAAIANDKDLIEFYSMLDPVHYHFVVLEYEEQLIIDTQDEATLKNTVAADLIAYNQANKELGAIAAMRPDLPPRPALNGNDLLAFKRREVLPGWNFGAWQGG